MPLGKRCRGLLLVSCAAHRCLSVFSLSAGRTPFTHLVFVLGELFTFLVGFIGIGTPHYIYAVIPWAAYASSNFICVCQGPRV